MRRLAIIAGVIALGMTGLAPLAFASGTPSVYDSCTSTDYQTYTTDANGLQVGCENLPGSTFQWLPTLRPATLPVVADLDPCSIPLLVARTSGGSTEVCEHHFNGLFYWHRSI